MPAASKRYLRFAVSLRDALWPCYGRQGPGFGTAITMGVLRYLPGPCTSVEKPAAAQRVHRCDLLKGRLIDLRRQRELHSLQNHGLRRSVPSGLLLRGREHARHPPGRMH